MGKKQLKRPKQEYRIVIDQVDKKSFAEMVKKNPVAVTRGLKDQGAYMGRQKTIKMRRRTRFKEMKKDASVVVNDFRLFVRSLTLRKRIRLAWKILTKTY